MDGGREGGRDGRMEGWMDGWTMSIKIVAAEATNKMESEDIIIFLIFKIVHLVNGNPKILTTQAEWTTCYTFAWTFYPRSLFINAAV